MARHLLHKVLDVALEGDLLREEHRREHAAKLLDAHDAIGVDV